MSGQAAAPAAQARPYARHVVLKGKLERIKVHGKSLVGNLLKESESPDVSVTYRPAISRIGRAAFRSSICHGYTERT